MDSNSDIGIEYTVIGWCTNKETLSSKNALIELLHMICSAIDMRSLDSIGVDVEIDLAKRGLERFHDEGGSSASLILSTSHACIHGWPEREDREDGAFFWLTIGSCRDFEPKKVDALLKDCLGVTLYDSYTTYLRRVDPNILAHLNYCS